MYKIIGVDQKEYGPISEQQLREWFTQGRANSQTIVWSEATNNWQPLGNYPEFRDLASAAPPLTAATMGVPTEKIPNYLIQSILCTLCCCLPFGVVAIIYAAQVNRKSESGDYHGARESSAKAKKWCWIAFGVGIVVGIIQLIYALSQMQDLLPK